MKKWLVLLVFLFSMSFVLIGCSSSSSYSGLSNGQSITLSKDAPVASTKGNVDKIISYLRNNNGSAIHQMELDGEAKTLKQGTKINIINAGTITEVEVVNTGEHWFAPNEIFK